MSDKQLHNYSFFIRTASSVAERYGVNATSLLAGTGLSPDVLADSYQLVSYTQELEFYRNLVQAIDVPWLGLEVGSQSKLSSLGSIGHVGLAARNIREVISANLQRYSLLYQHMKWDAELIDGEVIHSISDEVELGDLRRFMVDRVLAMLQCHAEDLIGPECRPNIVRMDFPDPGYLERYEATFHCPIRFNQPSIEIRYPFRFLDEPIPSHDPKVKEVLDGLCNTLMQKLSVEQDMVAEVKLALREKSGSFPNIERVAEKLDMSSRNLRRHLKDQGSSFQTLLNEARREVAEDYLLNSSLNIQEIADLCGFSDAQNFAQAFKRWTGQSPTELRKSQA